MAFSWCSYFRFRIYTFGCRSPRATSTPDSSPISHNYFTIIYITLSLNFWRRGDSTSFLSHSGALIFHSAEIQKTSQNITMSLININILAITITLFSKLALVWEMFSHSFLWGDQLERATVTHCRPLGQADLLQTRNKRRAKENTK